MHRANITNFNIVKWREAEEELAWCPSIFVRDCTLSFSIIPTHSFLGDYFLIVCALDSSFNRCLFFLSRADLKFPSTNTIAFIASPVPVFVNGKSA